MQLRHARLQSLFRRSAGTSRPVTTDVPTVAILSLNGAAVGGVTRVAIRLAEGLPSRGWKCEVLFPPVVDQHVLEDWCSATEVRWKQVPGLLPEASPRALSDLFTLWRIVRRHPARIVNIHYGGAAISLKDVLAVRLAGRKLVVTLHAPTPWAEIGHQRRRMTRIARHLVSQIVVVTEEIADVLVEAGIPKAKVQVIPGGVPVPTSLGSRELARRELGLPLEGIVVGNIARCAPEKRLHDLIAGVAALVDSNPELDVHLLIKGDDGPGTDELKTRGVVRLGGRFHLRGMSTATNAAVYSAIDIFCLPSDLEGYPLVLQEAAAYGLPAISTRIGGIPTLIDEGETGLLIEPKNVSALTAALRELASSAEARRLMGSNARTKAHAQFSQSRMCDSYAAAFAEAQGR